MSSAFASVSHSRTQKIGSNLLLSRHKAVTNSQQKATGRCLEFRMRRRCSQTIKAVATGKSGGTKPDTSKGLERKNESTIQLTPETAKAIYADMYLGREFEEKCAEMYYRGKMFG